MIVLDFGDDDPPPGLPSTRVLERFVAKAAEAIPLRGELSVLLTGDAGIRRLNREFRGKNKATDVLSFPAPPPAGKKQSRVAGDLAISIDTAARQAAALEHSLATEVKVLLLHGMLHLAGFDHEQDNGEMAARELELRRKLRLPGGLIERAENFLKNNPRVPHPGEARVGGTNVKASRIRTIVAPGRAKGEVVPTLPSVGWGTQRRPVRKGGGA